MKGGRAPHCGRPAPARPGKGGNRRAGELKERPPGRAAPRPRLDEEGASSAERVGERPPNNEKEEWALPVPAARMGTKRAADSIPHQRQRAGAPKRFRVTFVIEFGFADRR